MNTYLSKNFPIWRDSQALLIELEGVVQGFSRYHKYTIGSELRMGAQRVLNYVTHAINQSENRHHWLCQLTQQIEELKLQVQTAKAIKAFKNFKQFESIAALAVQIARQAKAWLKKSQNKLQRADFRDLVGQSQTDLNGQQGR